MQEAVQAKWDLEAHTNPPFFFCFLSVSDMRNRFVVGFAPINVILNSNI